MKQFVDWAKQYFNDLESRKLYPFIASWMWFLAFSGLLLMLASFGYYLWLAFAATSSWLEKLTVLGVTILGELVALGGWVFIEKEKLKGLSEKFPVSKLIEKSEAADHRRTERLRAICGVGDTEFAQLARLGTDLLAVERLHKLGWRTDASFWRGIFDLRAKERMLTLLAALIATFAGFLVVSSSVDDVPYMDHIFGIGRTLLWVELYAAALFIVWLGFDRGVTADVVPEVELWMVRLSVHPRKEEFMLRYMLADLVRLSRVHSPKREDSIRRRRSMRGFRKAYPRSRYA